MILCHQNKAGNGIQQGEEGGYWKVDNEHSGRKREEDIKTERSGPYEIIMVRHIDNI